MLQQLLLYSKRTLIKIILNAVCSSTLRCIFIHFYSKSCHHTAYGFLQAFCHFMSGAFLVESSISNKEEKKC